MAPNSTNMGGFYDVGAMQKIAINLFYGWGYNFYRKENQLRADDQLVRARAGELLGQAAASLVVAESDYRREHLPPPTRDKPRPDAEAMANAQALERLGRDLSALKGRLAALPVPENDRMMQRYRNEAETLAALVTVDEQLIGQAEMLRVALQDKDGEAVLAEMALLQEGLAAIGETLRQRAAALGPRG